MIVLNETPRSAEEIAALEALAARVANSPQLHASPKLRDFFSYVIDCALRNAPDEATEQQIGIHVFHRHPGYNSGDDSIVRSQARLLRAKVNAYFANDGSDEPVIIEIPKGQYFPVFRAADEAQDAEKQQPADTQHTAPDPEPVNSAAADQPRPTETHGIANAGKRRRAYAVLCVAGALALGIWAGYAWKSRRDHPATPVLDAFWKPLYASSGTLVIYSNPVFVGNPTTGLRLLTPMTNGHSSAERDSADSGELVDETYTGTGEAESIHTLTALFDAHGARFTLKRSNLVTWDEARSRNLIFIGAPSQNTALNDLQTLTQFSIAVTPDHHGYIVNLHPRAGEPTAFPLQSPTQGTAIVGLLPGLRPETRIVIFSGLSTVDTQGAVEFLNQTDSIRTLIKTVGTDNGVLKPFEAVLNINTSEGVAVNASFLAIHNR